MPIVVAWLAQPAHKQRLVVVIVVRLHRATAILECARRTTLLARTLRDQIARTNGAFNHIVRLFVGNTTATAEVIFSAVSSLRTERHASAK
jgi:hypothetical protein